jgi:hypothetical protein
MSTCSKRLMIEGHKLQFRPVHVVQNSDQPPFQKKKKKEEFRSASNNKPACKQNFELQSKPTVLGAKTTARCNRKRDPQHLHCIHPSTDPQLLLTIATPADDWRLTGGPLRCCLLRTIISGFLSGAHLYCGSRMQQQV